MQNLDWFLDTARERLALASDHQLCAYLGASRSMVTQWRCARTWPSSRMMVKLAAACDVPADVALARLAAWKEPDVLEWRALADKLAKSAAALVVAVFAYFVDFDGGASARTLGEQPATASSDLYIMRQLRAAWWRRLLAFCFGFLRLFHSRDTTYPARFSHEVVT